MAILSQKTRERCVYLIFGIVDVDVVTHVKFMVRVVSLIFNGVYVSLKNLYWSMPVCFQCQVLPLLTNMHWNFGETKLYVPKNLSLSLSLSQ